MTRQSYKRERLPFLAPAKAGELRNAFTVARNELGAPTRAVGERAEAVPLQLEERIRMVKRLAT